jgi:hypothetical protein
MTYSDFTSLTHIEEYLHVQIISSEELFANVSSMPLPEHYDAIREENVSLALGMNTEKARSEFIIAPLLVEAWRMCKSTTSLFSGIELKVLPEQGLSGRCDFLFSASPDRLFLKAPILTIVEAKNDNVQNGLAQCVAEMVAAVKYNEARNRSIDAVYGCSTTGTEWRFLRLQNDIVSIDFTDYLISEPAKILGVLVHILQTAVFNS